MTAGATLVASLLVILSRPATWPLALASFLVRGGFLLVLAPIVVLPTAVGLANVLAPPLTTLVFRGITPSIALALAGLVVAALVWLIGGGLLSAAAEAELVRRVAADEDAWPAGASRGEVVETQAPAWRLLTVRLLAHLPLVLALAWGAIRIVTVAYRELSVPSDTTMPVAVRIAAGAPDALAAVIGAWLLGETVGSLAARRVAMLGERVPSALGRSVVRFVRHPLRTASLALVPLAPLVLVLVAAGLAGSAAWDALQASLSFGTSPLVTIGLVMLLVILFGGGLLLVAVTSAWRAAVWTVDLAGTFGATTHDPQGGWKAGVESATLSELRPGGVDPQPEVSDVLAVDRLRKL